MKFKSAILMAMASAVCSFAQADSTSAEIPLSMEIKPLCTIDTPTKQVVVPVNGTSATAKYTVTCNTGYSIAVSSRNYFSDRTNLVNAANNQSLYTLIGTKGPNNSDIGIMYAGKAFPGSSVDQYNLDVRLNSPVTATTLAGTYTDTYKILVTY